MADGSLVPVCGEASFTVQIKGVNGNCNDRDSSGAQILLYV